MQNEQNKKVHKILSFRDESYSFFHVAFIDDKILRNKKKQLRQLLERQYISFLQNEERKKNIIFICFINGMLQNKYLSIASMD